MLATAALLLVRLLVRSGTLPSLGNWSASDTGAWIDAQLVGSAVVLTSLRDLWLGGSPGKWLLCLRLARPDGRRLGFAARLWRAPISLLPFAWLSRVMQERMSWRVVGYAPGVRGLALRTAVTAAAAVASLGWAIETMRPSIGNRDAERLSQRLLQQDPILRRELGEPLGFRIIGITDRAHQVGRGQLASFELMVNGTVRRQDMVVHARKVSGVWVIEEIDDIAITAIDPGLRDPVAER